MYGNMNTVKVSRTQKLAKYKVINEAHAQANNNAHQADNSNRLSSFFLKTLTALIDLSVDSTALSSMSRRLLLCLGSFSFTPSSHIANTNQKTKEKVAS